MTKTDGHEIENNHGDLFDGCSDKKRRNLSSGNYWGFILCIAWILVFFLADANITYVAS